MPLLFARVVVAGFELYALIGLLFAIVFLPRAVVRIDERLRESPLRVRLLLLPGVAALWPLFASRWRRSPAPTPIERTAHRAAAHRAAPSRDGAPRPGTSQEPRS